MRDGQEYAKGLHELADFAGQHPELFDKHCGETFNIFAYTSEEMAEKTRLLGTSKKVASDGWYTMSRRFGPHQVDLSISRNTFCERVQTGTKTVEKPDPEALKQVPTIEVEEPVYEWTCPETILRPEG